MSLRRFFGLLYCLWLTGSLSYTFLRLGLTDYLLESDLLDHVDLHSAKPSPLNARVTDLGTGELRRTRLGVYLHWVLPPFYRQALGSAGSASGNDTNIKQQVLLTKLMISSYDSQLTLTGRLPSAKHASPRAI